VVSCPSWVHPAQPQKTLLLGQIQLFPRPWLKKKLAPVSNKVRQSLGVGRWPFIFCIIEYSTARATVEEWTRQTPDALRTRLTFLSLSAFLCVCGSNSLFVTYVRISTYVCAVFSVVEYSDVTTVGWRLRLLYYVLDQLVLDRAKCYADTAVPLAAPVDTYSYGWIKEDMGRCNVAFKRPINKGFGHTPVTDNEMSEVAFRLFPRSCIKVTFDWNGTFLASVMQLKKEHPSLFGRKLNRIDASPRRVHWKYSES